MRKKYITNHQKTNQKRLTILKKNDTMKGRNSMEFTNQTLHQILIRLEEKVDKEIIPGIKATNGRVRKLEVWRGWITGGLTVIGGIVGYLFKLIQ